MGEKSIGIELAMLPKNRPPTHSGEMFLEEFLKPAGISQKDFAEHLRWPYARFNEIIHGKRGVPRRHSR